MPSNRNAQLRYQVIDRCLKNRGRQWTWQTILEEVNTILREDNPKSQGIGKTTLYEDLKDIEYRVYNGEIERRKIGDEKKTVYLRYADPDYSINNQPLSETETNQLKSAIQILSRFKGMPQFEWINEIIPAIETKLGLVSVEKEIISFESNDDYEGLTHISTFFNAIVNKRVLKITYQDFKSPLSYELDFHPYFLKQFNSRWFVLGYNPDKKNRLQNLALDRVKKGEEINSEFVLSDINWDDYFADFVGVSRMDASPIEIKIFIVDAEQAAYIKTKPLHQTQKQIKQVENGFETSINVIPNYELEKLILSFGERIKILSPDSFREKMKDRIEKMLDLY